MRVLLDEGVPHPLAFALGEHDVQTVDDIGCNGIKNGKPLDVVDKQKFNAFVTADKSIPSQQRFSDRSFGIIVLSTNNWPVMREYVPSILVAIDAIKAGTVTQVDCGSFLRLVRDLTDPKHNIPIFVAY